MTDKAAKAAAVAAALAGAYGVPEWRPHFAPVDELILTILSANTNDRNSLRAFQSLKARFHDDWEAVRTADLDEIKEAIAVAGMYNQKAPHIVASLEKLQAEVGAYSLDHLAEMPVDEALAYLQGFPGVGHKTASIVLLFCFRKATFPVDTHIQRQSRRLGISRAKASPLEVKRDWERLLPDGDFYTLHLNFIQHGREVCDARAPRCAGCVLLPLCDYGQAGETAADERR